jgi:hypothetical protein
MSASPFRNSVPVNPAFETPRKKHSHRCKVCGNAVYCYKKDCQKPAKIAACANCVWQLNHEPTTDYDKNS